MQPGEITRLLQEADRGDREAENRLFVLVEKLGVPSLAVVRVRLPVNRLAGVALVVWGLLLLIKPMIHGL